MAAGATAARRPAAGDSPDHDELLAADEDVRSAGAGVFAKWAESEQKELDDTRATSRRSSSGGASQQRRLSARGEVRQRVKEARARDREASPKDAALANGTAPAGAPVKLEHATKEQRDKLFRRMDVNGNGTLSLAEIDKAIVELWPQFNRKKALMRAYHAADVSEDQYVQRREFRLLLRYVVYFNNLWDKFEDIDANGDHRLDLQEFKDAGGHLGITVADWKAEADFKAMDANGGGYVMFDEFCRWCVGRLELNAKNEGASDDEEDDEVYTRGGKDQYRQRARKSQYSSDDDEDSEEEEQERAYESSRRGGATVDGANGSLSSLASGSQSRTSSAVSSGFRRRVSDQYLENLAGELERLDDEEAREEATLRAQAAMEPEPQAPATNEGSRDAPSSSSSSEDGEAVLGAPAPEPAAASDRREERGQEQRQEEEEEGGSAEGGGAAGAGDDQTARKLRQLDGKLTEALTKQAEQRSIIDKLHELLGKQREKAAAEKRRHMAEVDALQEELSRERRERRHLELQSREQRRSASVGRQRRSSVGAGEPSTPRSRRGSNPASPASAGGPRSSGATGRRRSSRADLDLDLDLEEEDGSERPRIFDKLTDPTQYTGSHKHRFDEHGNVRRTRPTRWMLAPSSDYLT